MKLEIAGFTVGLSPGFVVYFVQNFYCSRAWYTLVAINSFGSDGAEFRQ